MKKPKELTQEDIDIISSRFEPEHIKEQAKFEQAFIDSVLFHDKVHSIMKVTFVKQKSKPK